MELNVPVYLRMGADLVAFIDHPLDEPGIIINVAPVLAVDEEGRLGTSSRQLVEYRLGVDEWTIVKGQGDGTRGCAVVDDDPNGRGGNDGPRKEGRE